MNYINIKTISILIISFFTIQLFAQKNEHGVGNGGGVICIKDKCETLVEAGLKVDLNYPDFWVPSNTLIQAVTYLTNRSPFSTSSRKALVNRIFLNLTHFKKVDIVDQSKLDTIIDHYKKTLLESNPQLDLTNFKIAAISSDNTSDDPHTFLLPTFFQLNETDQAKILIHEGIYRGQANSDLNKVLQFDSALSFFITDKVKSISSDAAEKLVIDAQIALINLNIITKSEFFLEMIYSSFSDSISYYINQEYTRYNEGYASSNLNSALYNKIFKPDNINKILTLDKSNLLSSQFDSRVKVFFLNIDYSQSHCNKSPDGVEWHSDTIEIDPKDKNTVIFSLNHFILCMTPNMDKQKYVLPN